MYLKSEISSSLFEETYSPVTYKDREVVLGNRSLFFIETVPVKKIDDLTYRFTREFTEQEIPLGNKSLFSKEQVEQPKSLKKICMFYILRTEQEKLANWKDLTGDLKTDLKHELKRATQSF